MIYKHYKGGLYLFLMDAIDSETLEELVVYQSVKDNKVWVRPKKMFNEILGNGQRRFEVQ